MEMKLNDLEILTILQGLEALYDQSREYKDVVYDNQKDFLVDINKIRSLHNKLLVEAQNEGYLEKDAQFI